MRCLRIVSNFVVVTNGKVYIGFRIRGEMSKQIRAEATDRLRTYLEQEKRLYEYLERTGMSRMELDCLVYIGMKRKKGIGEVSFEDIVRDSQYDSVPRISAAVSNQFKAGLVNKRLDARDSRFRIVSLTSEGVARYLEIEALFGETQGEGTR